MIYHNFKAYSLDDKNAVFHHMRVENGTIKICSKTPIHPHQNEPCIDLQAQTVIPGFHDAHLHLGHLGKKRRILDCKTITSLSELDQALRRYQGDPPRCLIGSGLKLTTMNVPHQEIRHVIDSYDHPCVIYSVDGHALYANTSCLQMCDISGHNGFFIDDAMQRIQTHLPKDSDTVLETDLCAAQDDLLRHGITACNDATTSAREAAILAKLDQEQRLKIRVDCWLNGFSQLSLYHPITPTTQLQIRGIKLFADGALGSRGALLSSSYEDGSHGLELLSKDQLKDAYQQIFEHNFQPVTHCIGDRAVANAVTALTELSNDYDISRYRPRLEHLQFIAPEMLTKMAKLGIIASVQPCHYASDRQWLSERFPQLRQSSLLIYPAKSFLQHGCSLALSTDAPVEAPQPLFNYTAAVTRNDDEKLSRVEALRAYCQTPAFANFNEGTRGSLQPGFLADFITLSDDILTVNDRDLPTIAVTQTFINGIGQF